MLTLEDACFTFPGATRPLWSGITLSITAGDRVLITGASGCGKSTLLAVLAGLIPRYGAGSFRGSRVSAFASQALVLQNPEAQQLTPSVYEEIAFALENRGWEPGRIRERIEEIMDDLGLGGLATRPPSTLSGGESQRLALACACAQDPQILFLDEPVSYLDPAGTEEFYHLLQSRFADRTMVMVEHRGAEGAARFMTRILHLGPDGLEERPRASLGRLTLSRPLLPVLPALEDSKAGLVLDKVAFGYGNALFQDVSGYFAPGKVHAIAGASGAGKSTLLGILAGVVRPSAGTVTWRGQILNHLSLSDRSPLISWVPQNPEHYFLAMTVGEEFALQGLDREAGIMAARTFGLEHRLDLHPASLSEGEKRRLSLALVHARPRDLVLLDEPSYGLDQGAMKQLVEDIHRCALQGKTVIMVTHSAELASCANQVHLLDQGRLTDCPGDWWKGGTPGEKLSPSGSGLEVPPTQESRFNPLAVLGGLCCFLILPLLSMDPVSPLLALALGGSTMLILTKPRWKRLGLILFPLGLGILGLFLVNLFFGISPNSLDRALSLTSRALALGLLSAMAAASFSIQDLVRTLMQQLSLSKRWGYAVFAGLNLVPGLRQEWTTMALAKTSRLGKDPGANPLAMPVLLLAAALRRAERMALSMASREIESETPRTHLVQTFWMKKDSAYVLLSVSLALVSFYLAWSWGSFRFDLG